MEVLTLPKSTEINKDTLAVEAGPFGIYISHSETEGAEEVIIKTASFDLADKNQWQDYLKRMTRNFLRQVVVADERTSPLKEEIVACLSPNFQDADHLSLVVKAFQMLVRTLPKNDIVYEIGKETVKDIEATLELRTRCFGEWFKTAKIFGVSLHEGSCKWTTTEVDGGIPYVQADPALYPCLLVTLGANCQIIKLEADGSAHVCGHHENCGITLQAMASLFLGIKGFQDTLETAEIGSNEEVDRMVSDTQRGLCKGTVGNDFKAHDSLLFSYGKALQREKESFHKEDIMSSILGHLMSTIAMLVNTKIEEHKVDRVFFGGSLVSYHVIRNQVMRNMAMVQTRCSKPNVEYNFLLHGRHYGVIGALLGDAVEN